jgi:2,4-dienoyl-CoA reductase-like NADH-dependent reductase (Old Yellow Enzyme family)/thioredoxin reductase
LDYNKRDGELFEGFREYAHRIKKHGAIAMVEFGHDLMYAEVKESQSPYGPVAFVREDGKQVLAMDEPIMAKICEDIKRATKFMMAAGFDGVLLHGGHGFLFQAFISPYFNTRTDEYGGSMVNRARFPNRVLDALREAGGENMILELRFSAEDGLPGGMTIDDTVEFCKLIDGKVDIIHVSNGLKWRGFRSHTFTSMYDKHGYNVPFAEKVKKAVTKSKVAVIGGINSPELGEEIIASGKADLIVIGRQAYADPEFPNKSANGQEDRIRRCVRCYHCYPGNYREHDSELPWNEFMTDVAPKMIRQVGQCAINPTSNYHIDPEDYPAPKGSRKVLIVGGGIAGMQAAITANDRGHKVTIAEKTDVLGGLLNFADLDLFKIDLREFKDLMIREVKAMDIELLLNTEVTPDFIKKMKPDVLIIAVGSAPVVPPIPGIENAIDALTLYWNQDKVGKRVIMIGGGLVGCETSLSMAAAGHEVTVVEMLGRFASEIFAMPRAALLDEMEKRGIRQLVGQKCTEVRHNGVKLVDNSGQETFLEADTICYSVGMKAKGAQALKEAAGDIPVFMIGDCLAVGKVASCTESAYRAALEIV